MHGVCEEKETGLGEGDDADASGAGKIGPLKRGKKPITAMAFTGKDLWRVWGGKGGGKNTGRMKST